MPSTGKIPGRIQDSEAFSFENTNYTLATRLEVLHAKASNGAVKSTLWYEARFSLKQEGEPKGMNVGNVYSWKILATDDHKLVEPNTVLSELYDGVGNVRYPHQDWATDLQGDSILFLDTLVIYENWRGTGLAKVAMQAFHRQLPQISNEMGHEGTIVLSPAASADYRGSSTMTNAQIEEALIEKLCGPVGYDLWVKGDEDEEGSVTVMGLVIRANDLE